MSAAEPASDDLVAFLDGELPPETAAQMERTLAENPQVRRNADLLDRTYKLLDELETPQASQEFTTQTLQSIQALSKGPSTPAVRREIDWRGPARKGGIIAGWLAGLGLASILGYIVTSRWISPPQEELLEELPMVENYEHYSDAGSVEFLKKLQDNGVFNGDGNGQNE